ncbi:MAG: sulfite exporter TauE/SafE family protein [Proteobacteria bacterium]|nr:sulfite exporter TauE/SafE family protein [Pseudomonadota bacterium]
MTHDLLNSLCLALPQTADMRLLALSLFGAAMAGSFTHCAFMCGPFVMMQTTNRLSTLPPTGELQRLKGALLLPYHLGRITTYTLLGALIALAGRPFIGLWQPFAAVLMLLAGAVMVASAFNFHHTFVIKHRKTLALQSVIRDSLATLPPLKVLRRTMARLMAAPTGLRGYFLGVLLGFLPCGMVYAALAVAATAPTPLVGAGLLFSFGCGTFPGLFAVSLLGTLSADALKKRLYFLTKIVTLGAGAWLCAVALGILIN